jgi:hypothetical protein
MLTKQTFVFAIESIEKQYNKDKQVAELLAKAFPESSSANMLYDNHYLNNALLLVLQEQMEGINKEQSQAINKGDYRNGHSWIEWFCFETNFGKESNRLKAYDKDKNVIPLSNASQLYDFLVKEKESKK